MNETPAYLHRPGDLPRVELMQFAERLIGQYGGPKLVEVHFKFTCIYCGARCTLSDANILYEWGECAICGKNNQIDMGGITLHMKL